jgi:hypothetical protein
VSATANGAWAEATLSLTPAAALSSVTPSAFRRPRSEAAET